MNGVWQSRCSPARALDPARPGPHPPWSNAARTTRPCARVVEGLACKASYAGSIPVTASTPQAAWPDGSTGAGWPPLLPGRPAEACPPGWPWPSAAGEAAAPSSWSCEEAPRAGRVSPGTWSSRPAASRAGRPTGAAGGPQRPGGVRRGIRRRHARSHTGGRRVPPGAARERGSRDVPASAGPRNALAVRLAFRPVRYVLEVAQLRPCQPLPGECPSVHDSVYATRAGRRTVGLDARQPGAAVTRWRHPPAVAAPPGGIGPTHARGRVAHPGRPRPRNVGPMTERTKDTRWGRARTCCGRCITGGRPATRWCCPGRGTRPARGSSPTPVSRRWPRPAPGSPRRWLRGR